MYAFPSSFPFVIDWNGDYHATMDTSVKNAEFCETVPQQLHGVVPAKSIQLSPTLCNPMDHSLPGSPMHQIFQLKHWSWLPWPPPGDLPYPGIELTSLTSPAWQAGPLPLVPPGMPHPDNMFTHLQNCYVEYYIKLYQVWASVYMESVCCSS